MFAVDSTEISIPSEISANQISKFCSYFDGLMMIVCVTGIVRAGAGADEWSIDIITGWWIFDIPECHWEAAALLAVGSILYMGSPLFE